MQHITTTIDIHASAERVWAILADFAAYPLWNPFVRAVVGEQTPGSRLDVIVQPQGGKAMSISPRLLVFSPGKEFRWKGQLLIPGVFDGEHYFQLKQTPSGHVQFIHGEVFSGLLVPLVFRGALRRGTEQGFESMNKALKQRAEG